MANRITVTICGEDYTFMAEESLSYMQKVAALVDAKMSEIMGAGGRVSRMDAAALTAWRSMGGPNICQPGVRLRTMAMPLRIWER